MICIIAIVYIPTRELNSRDFIKSAAHARLKRLILIKAHQLLLRNG